VRKASAVPAVLGTAFSLLLVCATLEARAAGSSEGKSSGSRAVPSGSRKTRTLIRQTETGNVVIERLDVVSLNVYGPPFPIELHNYPQPLCEQVDTVVEVRLHDADAGNPDTLEVESAEVSRDVVQSTAGPGLSRMAQKLSSIFRPKSAEARVRPEDVDLDVLLSQGLRIPVEGVDVERLRDSFLSQRGKYAKHLAIDIGAPRGTPVLATTDGQIVKVIREQRGGKSIYQRDATGKYLFFYCHLSRYADNLSVGQRVRKGDLIGYVGATGHVIGGPHLHFSITRLPEDGASFKAGLAINPYLLFLAGVP
jgi:murein DD-endopeptidase MepM/ murein hydrolase activator NlpD